jgi:hypothetical protein
MRRRARQETPSPVSEIREWVTDLAVAAERGDTRAAQLLPAAESWRDMAAAAPDTAELALGFLREVTP